MERRPRRGASALAVLCATAGLAVAAGPAQAQIGGFRGSVTVDRGTNTAVAASPDGRTLVMDLQGVLWRVPAGGGRGRALTGELDDPAVPSVAPDGGRVVFQDYREGTYDLWTMRPDGSDERQLTSGPYDDREPVWSPDGTRVAFSSDRSGSYDVWVLDVTTGALRRWTQAPTQESQPTWSPDGREIAYVVGRSAEDPERLIGGQATVATRTVEASAAGAAARVLATETAGTVSAPSWSPDGTLAYVHATPNRSTLKVGGRAVSGDEDVFPFRAQWLASGELLYTADGRIRRRSLATGAARTVPFSVRLEYDRPDVEPRERAFSSRRARPVRGIVKPVLSPDGERVAFGALGDLWVMDIGERPRRITGDRAVEDDPAWSPDGRQLAFVSDRLGSADVYVRDVEGGSTRRVTDAPGAEISPAWSPDGARLAFQDEEDATLVLDLASGTTNQVVPPAWLPGPPTWGPDGRTIALAALRPYSDRFREGTSQILTVDVASGQRRFVQPLPFASLSNRVNSGPVWSPDGRSVAFVLASRLWVLPVDAAGQPTGEPRRVTDEIAESPSWSGDSQRLLYQSRDRLRLVDADGGSPRTVPVELSWRRARGPRELVIRAGALWDGVQRRLRRDVDVVVRDDRIVAVREQRGELGRDDVDASGLTVMPGLWDAHVHQELQRAELGARQGAQQLAWGVTTTVSMGDTAYEVLEDREALAAGRRVGPRLMASGEPIDGSRVYYDFMRPVRDEAELERELQRLRPLDYDLLKTYVRLPYRLQERAIDVGHALGLPAFSHYWHPPIAFGQDGISHITATQRLGFSRTQSPSGFAYDDVIRTAAGSKMSMTSTLFGATTLLGEDPGLATDPRVRELYTPAQREELEELTETATTTDQQDARVSLGRSVGILRDILRGGGRVLAGTDIPLDPVGVHLHLNLRAMVRYGLTPYEALRTATALPARQLGVEDEVGAVRPGRLADLTIVEGDPLGRIEDAARVQAVVRDGRVHRVDDLLEEFGAGGR